MELKAGDQVQLKSGGPRMTVASLDGTSVNCAWFDEKNELRYARLVPETLDKLADEGRPKVGRRGQPD